ncbi:hypothetical protein [Parachlamydia sp. AcF125]|uniref:hypothetical protein n=1 Tax=Parachlamydia sp. AcF125 TaxID=2795736 RepID=UPI001BCA2D0E|nr:hypothetical protein [Parachlamydia sp. AcF125]MBS4167902.1 hypothetical protein [Parachlamydia sp. AcF125]
MERFFKKVLSFLAWAVLSACSSSDLPLDAHPGYQKGEYIYRVHDEYLFAIPLPEGVEAQLYPWEKNVIGGCPKITKEFFRCKGSSLNPEHVVQTEKETKRFYDCSGKHSLPLREGEEFIYPILIDLLNDIQAKTNSKVVITCGHSCPDHHAYSDQTPENRYSKHMIGAEVAFYVQGMENNPQAIIEFVKNFYKNDSKYLNKSEYTEFKTEEKSTSNLAKRPLYNKEIYIKIFKETEGRNFDNRHPYPYIAIQVRHDFDQKVKVTYSWNAAYRNYLRW